MPMLHYRWSPLLLALLLALGACSYVRTRGTQPDVRRLPYRTGEVDVDARIHDATAFELAEELHARGLHMSALWNVPGEPDLKLAIITRPPMDDAYGPQLAVIARAAGVTVVYQTERLFDDDFIYPTYFRFADRTLLLADHGSEDAYGVLAWSFERGGVRDLGELPIALPEDGDVFTRGAAPTARVDLNDGAYVIRIPGPVLLHPRDKRERILATAGEVATFREVGGKFELLPGRLTSR